MKSNTHKKLSISILILSLLVFIFVFVIGLLPDSKEGYVASCIYVAKLFLFLTPVGIGLDIWSEQLMPSNKKLTFIAKLRLFLFGFYILFVCFSGIGSRAYYAIFEKQQTATITQYKVYLADKPYLHFNKVGKKDIMLYDYKVPINEISYNRLNRLDAKSDVDIIITYKPKAQILYDLKILPR